MTQPWKMPTDETADQQNADQPVDAGTDEATPRALAVNVGTIVLFGVFLGGLAMIYFLGLQARPKPASAQQVQAESQVDTAIAEIKTQNKTGDVQSMFRDTDEMIRLFYNYPGLASIPAEKLPAAPFERDAAAPVTGTPVAADTTDNSYAERQHLQKIAEAFSALRLQTIMYSKRSPTALINNDFVTVGSRLGEFTVVQIRPQVVILRAGSTKYELKMNNN